MILETWNRHKVPQSPLKSKDMIKGRLREENSEKKNEKMYHKSVRENEILGGFISFEANKSPKRSPISFSGISNKIENALTKFGNKDSVKKFFTLNNNTIKFLEKIGDSQVILEAFIILILSVGLKPILTMNLKSVKEEDRQYSVAKTVIGAIIDFSIAMLSTIPLKLALGEMGKKLSTLKETNLSNEKKFKSFKKMCEYLPKYGLIPLRAFLTIALLNPTLKLLFPEKYDEKQQNGKIKGLEVVKK